MYPKPEGGNRTGEDRRRILVVDPDPRVAEALALALRQRAQVEWATSGMAGLMMAAEQEVDLAVIRNPACGHCPVGWGQPIAPLPDLQARHRELA